MHVETVQTDEWAKAVDVAHRRHQPLVLDLVDVVGSERGAILIDYDAQYLRPAFLKQWHDPPDLSSPGSRSIHDRHTLQRPCTQFLVRLRFVTGIRPIVSFRIELP
jgi:hypothetical protein